MSPVDNFFRKKFPYFPPRAVSYVEWCTLQAKYISWLYAEGIAVLLVLFLLPWLYSVVFNFAYLALYGLLVWPPAFFFPVSHIAFFIPGIILGLATALPVTQLLIKTIFTRHFGNYMIYKNTKAGFDNGKVNTYMMRLLLYPFIITFIMTYTTRLIATTNKFTYLNLFDTRTHTDYYAKIKKVTCYHHSAGNSNNQMEAPYYLVIFKDGNSFNTDEYFDSAESAGKFINMIVAKGVSVDTADIDAR